MAVNIAQLFEEVEAEEAQQKGAVNAYRFDTHPAAEPYMPAIRAAEDQYGIPRNLLARVIQNESNYDPKAVSKAGARGIAQIMPESHPNVNPDDPFKAIPYAAKYLRENADRFGKDGNPDWRLGLAAFNSGPGTVSKYGGIPPYRETEDYVKRVHDDGLEATQKAAPAARRAKAAAPGNFNVASLFDSVEAEEQQGLAQFKPEQGYIETAAKGLVRGTEGLLSGAGSATRWLGDVTQVEALSKAGAWASKYFEEAAQQGWDAPDPRIFKGEFMDHPSFKRALGIVFEAIPSLALAYTTGGLVGGVRAGGAAAAGLLGLLEGAPQYEEAREAGKDVGDASAVGAISTLGTALLEYLPISRVLKGFEGGVVRRMIKGGAEEAVQEASQTVFQNLVAKIGYDDTQKLFEGIVESMIGGFGAGGIAAPTVQKLNEVLRKNPNLTEKDVDDANKVIEDNIAAVAEDAAKPKATTDTPVETDLDQAEATDFANDAQNKEIINKIAHPVTEGTPPPEGPGGEQAPAPTEIQEEPQPELEAYLAPIVEKAKAGDNEAVADLRNLTKAVDYMKRGKSREFVDEVMQQHPDFAKTIGYEFLDGEKPKAAPKTQVWKKGETPGYFEDKTEGMIRVDTDEAGNFTFYKTDDLKKKGKRVKAKEPHLYGTREEAEAALAEYAAGRKFKPMAQENYQKHREGLAVERENKASEIPEGLQPVADLAEDYSNAALFDKAIEDGTITKKTGISETDIRKMISDHGTDVDNFGGSHGLYAAAVGADQKNQAKPYKRLPHQFAEEQGESLLRFFPESHGMIKALSAGPSEPGGLPRLRSESELMKLKSHRTGPGGRQPRPARIRQQAEAGRRAAW